MIVLVAITVITGDLLVAVVVSLFVCLVMYIPQKLMTMEEYFNLIVQGFADMLPILMLLLIAFVLQSVTEGLGMTDYIIEVAQPFLTGAAFPAVVFVLLAAICFATGSLWG